MTTSFSLRAKLVSLLVSLGLGALLAFGAAAPVHAATLGTPPIAPYTLTGAASCGSDGTYTVVWTASGYLYGFTVEAPTVFTPASSRINYGPWIHGEEGKQFAQFRIPGMSTSASVTTKFDLIAANSAVTVTGKVALSGNCVSVATKHTAFKHYRR